MAENYMARYRIIRKLVSLNNHNYRNIPQFMGSGISRVVFDVGDYVVKYQYSCNDELLNKLEVDLYKQAVKKGIGHLLAKPIYTSPDYRWLIMEKMACTVEEALDNAADADERRKIEGEFYDTARKIEFVFPKLWDLTRHHKRNIMLDKDGKMKAVDYAW